MTQATRIVAAVCALVSLSVISTLAAPLALNGINDRGASGEGHIFELYGDFPSAEAVRPTVTCDGRLMDAEVMATPLRGQINVNVESMRGGATCSFQVQRLTDGARSGKLSLIVAAPPLEILGINDRGLAGGRRYVELYGLFPSAAALEPRVLCIGKYVPSRIEFASSGQVNVSLATTATAAKCAFLLRNATTGLASPTFGVLPNPTPMPTGFGGYHWGGVPRRTGALEAGQAALNARGVDVTRLVITPRVRSGSPVDNYYNFDLAALATVCPTTQPFLPCAIRWAPYQTAISSANLRTVILTAYDSASSGPTGQAASYLDPAFWSQSANRQAVQREYKELTYALYQTQNGSGKTFVVASWEADNQAYCGSFYSYWVDASFRASCGTVASRQAALGALAQWFTARKAGIREGELAAAADGYGGVTVRDGIEFNMNSLTYTYRVDTVTLPTVLRNVVPSVDPAFVLYSSYDSQFRGRMEQELRQIRDWLPGVSPGAELLVGEVGFARHGVDGSDLFRTVATVKAIQRVGLRATILWEAYDTIAGDRVHPYGILHPTGAPRRLMRVLTRELAAQAAELKMSHTVQILAASDRGVSTDGTVAYRYYELYGMFPGSGFAATALCDGIAAPIQVVYESSGQINVRIAHRPVTRFCTLRLQASSGAQSVEFGPVAACPDVSSDGPCS